MGGGPGPGGRAGEVERGRSGEVRWWRVGGDRVELRPDGDGWSARVVRPGWAGAGLDIDGVFGDEAGALAWCERMARVLAEDHEDAGGEGDPA